MLVSSKMGVLGRWYKSFSGDAFPFVLKPEKAETAKPNWCQSIKYPHSCEVELSRVVLVKYMSSKACVENAGSPQEGRQPSGQGAQQPCSSSHPASVVAVDTTWSVMGQGPRNLLLVKSFAFPRDICEQFNPLK